MRVRDIGIVVVCVIASIIAWSQDGSITVIPGFHVAFSDTESKNKYMPPPIVTDLASNGEMVVVLLRSPSELSVVATTTVKGRTQIILPLEDKTTALLPTDCVGMGTGYLDFPGDATSYDVSSKNGDKSDLVHQQLKRHDQFVATVTSGFDLTLFDANLTEVWNRKIFLFEEENIPFSLHYATVTILPDRVMKTDRGMVIISLHAHMGAQRELVNWVIAFEGGEGHLRWRHKVDPYAAPDETRLRYEEGNKFKFTEEQLEKHSEFQPWSHFRESVIATMPHSYQHIWDHKATPYRFTHQKNRKKREIHGNDVADKPLQRHRVKVDNNDDTIGELGQRLSAVTQATYGKRHRPLPNVIVLRDSYGVYIHHLFTGKPITSFSPIAPRVVMDDINDDGNVDAVSAFVGPQQRFFDKHGIAEENLCVGRIHTDLPQGYTELFSVDVCDTQGFFSALTKLHRFLMGEPDVTFEKSQGGRSDPLSLIGSRNMADEHTHIAPPLVMRQRIAKGRNIYEISPLLIFFVSGGHLTAVNAKHRRVEWRLDTDATFTKPPPKDMPHQSGHVDFDEKDSHVKEHPHVATFTFGNKYHDPVDVRSTHWHRHRNEPIAIAVGSKKMVFVDALHGKIMMTVEMPHAPVAPSIVADFNGDGVNDIIITTEKGYYGFIIQRHVSGSSTALLMLLTVACIGALILAKGYEDFQDITDLPGFGSNSRVDYIARRNMKRSTD